MSTYIVYKTLIDTYRRLGRDVAALGLKIDLAYALGRLSDEEYTELVAEITPNVPVEPDVPAAPEPPVEVAAGE